MEDHGLLLPLVDEENICLPLPVNVVSRYWDVELPMAEAAETAKRYSGFNGSVLIEGIELAERHGLACKIIHSSLPELKRIIGAGVPPIVILPGVPEITQHASVITGYSDEEGTIFHYVQKGTQEGEQQEGAIPQEIFDKEWEEEGRLAIVIGPPETISALQLEDEADHKSNRLCFASERHSILGDFAGAASSLRQAAEIKPENPTALYLLGSAMNQQNSSECLAFYEKCLKVNGRSYLTHNGLGNFYLKTNQFEKAAEHYTRAIEIDPKRSAKIYKNRAYLREKQGRNSEAKDDLKRYLKYLPGAPDRGVIEQAIREL